MNDSILNSRGLRNTIENRRAHVHKEFVCRSQVVFVNGQIAGHIFTDEQFKAFLELPFVANKEIAWDMWQRLSKAWGATAYRLIPIEYVDSILDLCAKISVASLK